MWTHDIDPTLFSLFDFQIRWYGLMYIIGFAWGTFVLTRLSKEGFLPLSRKEIDSLITSLIVGTILGARIVYVLIYNWAYYRHHLPEAFKIWEGGLSFHGALLGFTAVALIWSRRSKASLYQIGDSLALGATVGIGFGRIGNFINGELYGRMTGASWGVIFPEAGPYPRHPSQLYEALGEGFLLFALLLFVKGKMRYYGTLSATFLMGYALFRYAIEFFREPDSQLGTYLGGTTTMGQILCALMFCGGLFVYLHGKKLQLSVKRPS